MIHQSSLLLPALPFIPLLAALYVAFSESGETSRRAAFLAGTLPTLVVTAYLMVQTRTPHEGRPVVLTAWNEVVYADLLSLMMVSLTLLLVTLVGLYSFSYIPHELGQVPARGRSLRTYYSLLLVVAAFMIMTVTINHLFFMFLVIEVATICVSLLVATFKTKFALIASFKYNLLVVMAMLFAVLGAILLFGETSAEGLSLSRLSVLEMGELALLVPAPLLLIAAACFVGAFGTKGGMMPFHTWLPDAHSEAPAPISALLSGLIITVGPFGFARTAALFVPKYSSIMISVAALACASVVIGIVVALAQDDLKRLLAYSSISQIGYIFLGIALADYLGIYGGLFHLVTHLLAKSLLFLCAGAIIYRVGLRRISDLSGLARRMPLTAVCFFVGSLSMGGLPFMAGFMSKYTIILALAQAELWWALVITALAGTLTLAALVWAAHRVFWGPESEKVAAIPVGGREIPRLMALPMVLLAVAIVAVGLVPGLLYPMLDGAARSILALMAA